MTQCHITTAIGTNQAKHFYHYIPVVQTIQLKVNQPLGQTTGLDSGQRQEGKDDTDSRHRSPSQRLSATQNTVGWMEVQQTTLST